VGDWVLELMTLARRIGCPERAAGLLAMFDDEVVSSWLTSEDRVLAEIVLREISDAQLLPLVPRLLGEWYQLDDVTAGKLIVRLAKVAPAQTSTILQHAARTLDIGKDAHRVQGVVKAAESIGSRGVPAVSALVERLKGKGAPTLMYYSGIVRAAVKLRMPEAPSLTAAALIELAADKAHAAVMLEEVFQELAPDLPFFRMQLELEFLDHGYYFRRVPELFMPGAPVEYIDELAERGACSYMTLLFILEMGHENHLGSFAREMLYSMPKGASNAALRLGLLFVIACAAAQYAATSFQLHNHDLQGLLDVLTLDIDPLPCAEAVEKAILAKARPVDAGKIVEEWDRARSFRGASRLIRVMGKLGYPEFVDPLLRCVTEDEYQPNVLAAAEALANLGSIPEPCDFIEENLPF